MDIVTKIVENPEGGTACLALDGTLPDSGYFVGGVVASLVLPGDFLDKAEIEYFTSYLTDSVHVEYVGWWTDEETGNLWVDGTSWHADHDEAARVARERHEIAFWDIARERELRLTYAEGE